MCNDWRDIETAPKDGSRFLLCDIVERPEPIVVVGFWGTSNENEDGERATWRVSWDHTPLDEGYDPTHWMPLPAPPAPVTDR